MILEETLTLSNGVQIPKLGLGTWMIDDGKAAAAVRATTEIGYRHIDTAQAYGNERGVGEGVRASGIARDKLFVTTKLDAGIKDYEKAKAAIDGSLKTLGLDHIDLMIIHSPQPWSEFHGENRYFEGNVEAWRALEEAYGAGKLRSIGVSNFQKVDIDNLIEHASVKPMINQILAHVSNTPFDLIAYLESQNIVVEAYSPVGHGKILDNPEFRKMAERYGVSVPQLAIRYVLQLGPVALPKTANPDHMRNNADVDFEISSADMETLKKAEPIKDYGDASMFPVYSKP
ncbi:MULTISPECIES: aldo/keto reductase [unclassified Agrobacterium]|uniref:aldo/keto reductase n=1 Tax=unclassified Agrobacterium TaxID=2632611 RepID=UPI00244A815E|nr:MULTISPECIES: aldo/keto reductase [unclassified Agrobacterium]MDH0615644.1 aldo/keto reductase [Agrobacterium sp. GD03872]MDH0698783.1 aldo/keto reductase [Agrobacterium sp. GD03871]MDH1061456.1 aldo/keto reductase [Agrobacterium sp. GD03992]MDH2212609.1 aldo/keto reductase [Agrobacterium sp. GD03643]MDH2221038.1 aldo/keto reductase [Agrobacterium sp. GD03638]